MTKDVLIPVVNEDDEIIGYKPRNQIEISDIYRVAGLWITNSNGDVLIAQRAYSKKRDPGLWGPAVAGTVEKDETYEANIIKEVQEEIGINNYIPNLISKYRVFGQNNYFCALYGYTTDLTAEDFVIQIEEVEKLSWVPYVDLVADVKNNPKNYVPSFRVILNQIEKIKPK